MTFKERAAKADAAILERLSLMHSRGDFKLLSQGTHSPRLRILINELAHMVGDAEALHNGEEPESGDEVVPWPRAERDAQRADDAHDNRMAG